MNRHCPTTACLRLVERPGIGPSIGLSALKRFNGGRRWQSDWPLSRVVLLIAKTAAAEYVRASSAEHDRVYRDEVVLESEDEDGVGDMGLYFDLEGEALFG
jgi:hypothetical protein